MEVGAPVSLLAVSLSLLSSISSCIIEIHSFFFSRSRRDAIVHFHCNSNFFLFFYLKKVEVDADSELSAASKASFLDKVRQSNQACQNGDFETAVGLYGEAIALDPCNHILFSNRSAALVKLGHFARALQDASRAVELNAKWPKVSLRVKSLQPALLLQSIHLVLLYKHGALLFGSLYLDKEPRGGKTSSSFPPQNTKARFFSISPSKKQSSV